MGVIEVQCVDQCARGQRGRRRVALVAGYEDTAVALVGAGPAQHGRALAQRDGGNAAAVRVQELALSGFHNVRGQRIEHQAGGEIRELPRGRAIQV